MLCFLHPCADRAKIALFESLSGAQANEKLRGVRSIEMRIELDWLNLPQPATSKSEDHLIMAFHTNTVVDQLGCDQGVYMMKRLGETLGAHFGSAETFFAHSGPMDPLQCEHLQVAGNRYMQAFHCRLPTQ